VLKHVTHFTRVVVSFKHVTGLTLHSANSSRHPALLHQLYEK